MMRTPPVEDQICPALGFPFYLPENCSPTISVVGMVLCRMEHQISTVKTHSSMLEEGAKEDQE